jgi:hypothetical protein
MTINRSNITKQLLPGLNAVVGLEYGQVDNEHLGLFDIEKSERSFEEEVMMTGLGTAPVKLEGAPVQFDDMQETFSTRYNHNTVALAFAITEEAFEDNLYDTWSKARAKALGRGMANTKQVQAANVFNNGFSTSFPGGDGSPLFSTTHQTITGAQSNADTADLSETAVQNAFIAISLYKDDRGILIGATGELILLPPQLQFTAFKILKSDLSTTLQTNSTTGITNVNDVNALRAMGYFPKGMKINRRLTDPDAWFIRTDVPNGTKMFVRAGLQTAMEGDFDTGNLRYKARERYSFGWTDWRGWWGSDGSAQ